MSTKHQYRPDVDGLRAIAVAAVVLYHFDVRMIPGGFIGVDVFFAISGFVITSSLLSEIHRSGRVDLGAFYERRMRRLFPALFATIAITALIGMWRMSPSALQDLGQSTLASVVGFANVYFWSQSGYFDTSAIQKPLLHMWSLGVEEQFYLFWPAFLLFTTRLGPIVIKAGFACLFLISLALCIYVMRGFPDSPLLADALADGTSIAFYLTPFRVFEFVAGSAVTLFRPPVRKWVAETSSALGIGLVAWAMFTFTHDTAFPSYNALFPSVGAALVIYGGENSSVGTLLRLKPMVLIGLISYSVYLVHWPLVTFYRYGGSDVLSAADKGLLIALTAVTAVAMYRFVEQPFRQKGERLYFPRRTLFAGAAAGVVVAASFTVSSASGMVWRYPHLTNVLSAMSEYGGEDCPYPGCEVGLEGAPVLVIGDLFSRQLFAGLVAEFPEQRFIFRDQRTCATWSIQWIRDDPNTDPALCLPERETLFDHLKAGLPVILANHWGLSDLVDADRLEGGVLAEKKIEKSEVYTFAAMEVQRLAGRFDAPMLLVANPPDVTSLVDLEQCVFQSPPGACSEVPVSSIKDRRQFFEAADSLGLRVIDPYDAFCDEDVCRTYDDRGLYFSDPYHLSRLGARILAEEFRPQFEAFFDAVKVRADPASLLH